MKRLALAFAALLVLALPATAVARDRDHDGLPDRWEKKHHLSTKHSSANTDPDRDRVDSRNEYREGTNPRDRDSDDDGRTDGREDRDRDRLSNAAEDATGNDPRDPDTDDDGVPDGKEQAGTVSSFEDGQLTIDLANGGTVTGLVADFTDIRCRSEADAEREQQHKHGARKSNDGEPDEDLGDKPDESDGDLEEVTDGDDFGDDQDEDEHPDDGHKPGNRRCGEDALKPGARVHKAKLRLTADGLVFKRIELLG